MFIFKTNSWHYELVMYVFGNSFFSEKHFDHDKMVKKLHKIEEKSRRENPNDECLEQSQNNFYSNMLHNDELFTFTPKRINFCPYCRAVVMSAILFPFAVIKNLIPQRKKKPFDIKKSRRNVKIIKIVVIGVFTVWGTINLLEGNYLMAIFQYSVGSFQLWGKYLFEYIAKCAAKREKKKTKEEKPKVETIKNPSLFLAYLKSNHNKVCPPVTFVENNDTAVRV